MYYKCHRVNFRRCNNTISLSLREQVSLISIDTPDWLYEKPTINLKNKNNKWKGKDKACIKLWINSISPSFEY